MVQDEAVQLADFRGATSKVAAAARQVTSQLASEHASR
jgi:hypothetical protein